ncbi:MAG: glycoside hydrolase family 99-like domain-containing protein [Saccharofermentanales bacterium]
MKNKYDVACFNWSNWHKYAGNDKERGQGWTEWEYLKSAIPRFVGHKQPKKPLWGYLDDSKKETAELQIDAAADHGITAFIFDWGYSHDDGYGGHGNNLALEEGFLKADNRNRLDFGLMWCGCAGAENFKQAADYMIEKYFCQPNYWRVDGGLYVSVYEIHNFIKANGSVEKAAECVKYLRDRTRAAGYGEVHFAGIEWGLQDVHPEMGGDVKNIIDKLTIDSVTSYTWCHNTTPKDGLHGTYDKWAVDAMSYWDDFDKKFGVPYMPNVTMGWDPSPRCPSHMQYKIGGPLLYPTPEGEYVNIFEPYLSSIVEKNTPEQFGLALLNARKHLDALDLPTQKVVTLYAWNEWTEGGYLEPEEEYGMGYLEAIKNVFGG